MAFQLATNLEMAAKIPLDTRAVVSTTGERNAITQVYPGLTVYVTGENKYYYYDTNNSWVEFGFSQAPQNLVYTTGNQSVSGIKTFLDRTLLTSTKGIGFKGTGDSDFYGIYGLETNGGPFDEASQSGLSFYAGGTERMRIFRSGHLALDDYSNLPKAASSKNYKFIHFASNLNYTNPAISMASRNLHTIFLGNNSGQFILGTEATGVYGSTDERRFTWSGNRPYGWLFKSNLNYMDSNLFEGGNTVFFVDGTSGRLSGIGNFIDRNGQTSLDWNNRVFSGEWTGNIQDVVYTNKNQVLQQKYYPYIASLFSNNSIKPHGMHIVGSTDAVNWEIISTRKFSGDGQINTDELRDPSIIKLDNKWVIAFTEDAFSGWPYPRPDNSGYFGLLQSTDLVNWKYQRISLVNILRNNGLTDVTRLWAPEWFKEDNGDLYLTFSIGRTGWQYSPFGSSDGGGHMPYIIKATDYSLTGWTGFRRLSGSAFPLLSSFKTGVNHYSSFIDACIEKVSGVYYTPYSDGDNAETRLAYSTGLFNGWTVLASGKTWYGTGFPYVGAPTDGTYKEGGIIRFYNGKWRLWIFDVYGTNSGIYSEGLSPTGMSFVSLIKNNLGYRFDHGTVIKNDNYQGLLNQFDDQTISGTKIFVTKPLVNNTGIVLSGEAVHPLVDINNITSNFVFDSTFNSKLLTINATNNITGRVPTGLSTGYNVSFLQAGTGQLFISGSGGAIIRQRLNLYNTAGQYSIASLLHYSGNQFVLYGDLI